jgi:hypothetical protein
VTALKKLLLLALLALSSTVTLLAFSATAHADSANLENAEKLFQSGDWEKARQAYKTELTTTSDPGTLPAAFYFDYGTTLARAGASGEAYVSLFRAAASSPFDSDTKHNLRIVEGQLPAAVHAILPSAWLAWWPSALRLYPWKLWFVIGLALSAVALLTARLRDRAPAAVLGVIAAFFFLWGTLAYAQSRLPVFGVLSITKVKTGPGNTFPDLLTLEPGTLVNEETVRDGWLKIRFLKPDADEETVGWVEPTNVLRVM